MTDAEDARFAAEIAAVVREFGETNTMVADKHFEFGNILSQRPGEEKRAIWQLESCLSIQRANFGDMTLSVAVTLQKLGKLHFVMGNFKKALSAYYASLERYGHLFGKDTAQIADLLRDIAAVYRALKRDDAGDGLVTKASELQDGLGSSGQSSQYFIEIYADLADIVAKSGNYAESDGLFRTCIQLAAHHQSGRETARYNFRYAKQLESRFEQDLSEQYFHAAAELAIDFPELSLMTAECKYFLGHAAKDQHRLADAAQYLDEALALWVKHLGEKNPLVGKCYLKIAQIFRQMEEFDKAIYYHEKSIAVLTECSRIPPAQTEIDKIPGLREAASVDFLVHAKGELGITLQRHSQDEARRGNSLVTDAVSHLQGKQYSVEHPFISTLIKAKSDWREVGGFGDYDSNISLDLTASIGLQSPGSEDLRPPLSSGVLNHTSSDISRPPTAILSTGTSTPMSISMEENISNGNQFAESQFKEVYGQMGGSLGRTGEKKTPDEMIDSLLLQAGDMLFEGRYVPTNHTLMNAYNTAKIALHLSDPISGVRIPENVRLLNRIALAAAESARRIGQFEFAKTIYFEAMSARGIDVESPMNAAIKFQRSPYNEDKVGDMEVLLGYLHLLIDQENVLVVGDAPDVLAETIKSHVNNGLIELFSVQKDANLERGHGPSAKAFGRAGLLYIRTLFVAASCHLKCGRLVTCCQFLAEGAELCYGADDATNQMLSLLRIIGCESGGMYRADRRVLLGEFHLVETNFYLLKASVHLVLKDLREATECSRRCQSVMHSLGVSSSHPIVGVFELLASDISLCDGNIGDARVHNKKAFSIFSLAFFEDHPFLVDALFKSAELSRIEGKEHKAASTLSTVLEMTIRLRGSGSISESVVLCAQAANIFDNTAPTPAEFTEALTLLKAARSKMLARLPYETHYLILSVDLQVLDALRMQLCGQFAMNLNDIAGYIMNEKDLAASYDQIVKLAKEYFDADYRSIPSTLYAAILTGKGHMLRYLGQFQEAEILFSTASDLVKETFGSDEYPAVTHCRLNLAVAWHDRGRMYQNLASLMSADVEVKTRTYGKQHPLLAESLEALGRVLIDYGHFSPENYTRGQQVLVQAAVIRSHVYGVGSLPVASSEDALGVLYMRKNKHDDAVAYLSRALSVRVQNLGVCHRLTAESHAHLALAYWNIGDLNLCKEHVQQYYDTINGVLAGSHPMVLIAAAFHAKVRLAEIKTRIVKVADKEKEEIEKTYRNSREILMYGCGFERHTWWVMFLCGVKVASPSMTWFELSPPELDDPSNQFKCGSALATSIAGRLVRADTETNLLKEKHEKLVAERDELLQKFKHYEATMKIGDVMTLASDNKTLNEEIKALNQKLSEAGHLMVEKDVAELDLLSIYKIHRTEEELHKSELNRLRGAVSAAENKQSFIRLPQSDMSTRMDETSIYSMIDEKKHLKELLMAIEKKNNGLLRTRKAVTDDIAVIDEGIRKETEFLTSADADRNELLLQIGAGNVTTLKLATQLGKSKHGVGASAAIEEAIEICQSAFDEIVAELCRATEKDASVELCLHEIKRLKRDIESFNYELEVEIKNMSKRQIVKTKNDLESAEKMLLKRESDVVKFKDESVILNSHVVLLKCKLRDAQQLLYILKGVSVGKQESQYELCSSLWDKLYIHSKARDGVQVMIDNFDDIETDKSLNQLSADHGVHARQAEVVLRELKNIELQVPSKGEGADDDSVFFDDELSVSGAAPGAETDQESVHNAKEEAAQREQVVSTLWADVLGSLHTQEELKKKIAEVQSQIGTNEINMRNLRQSIKTGGNSTKSPVVINRQHSSSSANPRSFKEVNLILSEAEGRQKHLKEKANALNAELIAICERENMGNLVQNMSPDVVAESYSKELGNKIKQLNDKHAQITADIVNNQTDIALTSKDLHVLEVEISRVENVSKSANFQSRDPEVTRLVSVLKAKEINSIDEVEAEQQAFICVGILREKADTLRNELAVARQQSVTTPTNAGMENRSRMVGLLSDKKLLASKLSAASTIRDEIKAQVLVAKKDNDAVSGDAMIVAANNERAQSPLLKERGESVASILGKIKSSSDLRLEELKKDLAEAEDTLFLVLQQVDEVDGAMAILEEELQVTGAAGPTATKTPQEFELEEKVNTLERLYNDAITAHEAAQSSLETLKGAVKKSDEDKHMLRAKIQEMIAKEKEELVGSGSKLPQLIEDRSALSSKMQRLTQTLSENQAKEKVISTELKDSNDKYSEVNAALVETVKTQELRVSTDRDLKLLKGRSNKMEKELSTKIVDETPEEAMLKMQTLIDELTIIEQGFLRDLEIVERKIDTDQAALTTAVEASRVAKYELEKAESKFNDSHVKEQDSIVAVGLLEQQLRQLEENIAEEAENLQKLRMQRRQLADQLMKVDIEVVALNAERERLLSKNDPITPAEVEACQHRKEKIAKEIEILRAWVSSDEHRRMMEFHPDVKKKLEKDLREAKDLTILGLLSMSDSSKRYDQKIVDANNEIKSRDAKLKAAEENINELQNVISAQNADASKLQAKIDELSKLLSNANETIANRDHTVEEKSKNIKKLMADLEDLPLWEDKLNKSQQKVSEQATNIEDLTEEVHKKDDEINLLKTELESLRQEMKTQDSANKDLTKIKITMEGQLSRKTQECERVSERADKLQQDLETLQAKVLSHEVSLNKNEKERSRLSGEVSRSEDEIASLKKVLGPLEIKELHQREEIDKLSHHVKRLDEELTTALSMRKSLDPWGFGKEAEAGFSRFATIKNIVKPETASINTWDKDHEAKESYLIQKMAYEDPLQPSVKAFDQLNQGAAPVKIFGGVRALALKDDKRLHDRPCAYCGHFADELPSSKRGRSAKEMFLNDHLRSPPQEAVHSAPPLEGTSPRIESPQLDGKSQEGFGLPNARVEKPSGMFPAVDGAVKPSSQSRGSTKQIRVKKQFPDKLSKSTPSALHAAFGSEPFGNILGSHSAYNSSHNSAANSPNQSFDHGSNLISPDTRPGRAEKSVGSISTSRTTKL